MVKDNAAPRKAAVFFGLSGRKHVPGGITVATNRSFKLVVPPSFDPEFIQRTIRDYESLAAILREHPQEAADLFEMVVRNQDAEARELATRLGITEESFQAQGGGWVRQALQVAAFVAATIIETSEANGSDDEVPLFDDIDDIVNPPDPP